MLTLFHPAGWTASLTLTLLALLIDALIGDPPALWARLPHPVVVIGRLIAAGEKRLNRPERSALDRRGRGGLLTLLVVGICGGVGLALSHWAAVSRIGFLAELALCWALLAQRSLYDHVAAVRRGLVRGGLSGGRHEVAKIVGRDPDSLDEYGVARAAIESCAENFADGVVAPLFWLVLLGPGGLLAYKAVNTLDSMIGHRNERYLDFGAFAARLDDVANLLPARLAGVLLCLAARFVPGTDAAAGWRVMQQDHGHHRSPNSGWPEAAMAGVLGLALAGPRRYPGYVASEPWINQPGRARALPEDITTALRVMAVACLLQGGGVIVLLLAGLRG